MNLALTCRLPFVGDCTSVTLIPLSGASTHYAQGWWATSGLQFQEPPNSLSPVWKRGDKTWSERTRKHYWTVTSEQGSWDCDKGDLRSAATLSAAHTVHMGIRWVTLFATVNRRGRVIFSGRHHQSHWKQGWFIVAKGYEIGVTQLNN